MPNSFLVGYHIVVRADGRRKYASTDIPDAGFLADTVRDMLPDSLGKCRVEVQQDIYMPKYERKNAKAEKVL